MRKTSGFMRLAKAASRFTGRPLCFGLATVVVIAWVVTGPLFGFSNTWQLVINTGTTIVTFLMVFAIQTSQNREARATQLKLDEIKETYEVMAREARAQKRLPPRSVDTVNAGPPPGPP